MAAPDGIVWGSEVNGKGRIGIYTAVSSTNTQTTVSIQVWFWSKYGLTDSSNTLYFDTNATSATTSKGAVSINHTVSSGSGWSTTNQTKLGTYSYTYNRSTSNVGVYCAAKFANVDYVGGTMIASTTYKIPALTSYTVSYVANGGTGAPLAQVKFYDVNITLSTVKPTRTGYTFLGWSTSPTATTATYAAGATFSTNANTNLYAVWKAVTYAVTYNANGGTGAPSATNKTHGTVLYLSRIIPTRSGYLFMGWGTSATTTTVSYSPGQEYSNNAALNLYAVWKSMYAKPRVTNVIPKRCDSTGSTFGEHTATSTYFTVAFDWETDSAVTSIKVEWKSSSSSTWSSSTVSASGTSGNVRTGALGGGSISVDSSYDIRVTVADSSGSTSVTRTLQGGRYEIDFLKGGGGVAIGKPAETEDLFEVAYPANFVETASVKNKFIVADRCRVGQSTSTVTNPWYKFASTTLTGTNADRRISFKVTFGYAGNTAFGIVDAYARSGTDGNYTTGGVFVESNTGLDPRKFMLVYNGRYVELWVKIDASYSSYLFEVISENTRTDHTNPGSEYSWTLYDTLSAGSASAPTSGYAQVVGIDHASRVLMYDNTLIPGITSTTEDTPANWGAIGNAKYYWYNASGKLNDQHTQYGLLQNLSYGSDARQFWFTGTDLCYRGGNSSGWSGGWKTILHDDNYSNYALPLTGGSLSGAFYAANSVNAVGYSRFNNDWIGIYKSHTDAKNNTTSNRKGWIGFDGTNNFQFTNNSGGSNITSVAWTTSSDRRLKTDIEDIPDEFVGVWNELQPKIFKWSPDNSSDIKYHFGLIAQDVIAAFEKYNLNHEDYGFVNSFTLPDDDTVYYGIAYDEYHMLTSMVLRKTNTLLEAQQKQIDSLQVQINEIKARFS